MKITRKQLRKLIREQIARAVQLTQRQMSYIRKNGIVDGAEYGDPDEGQDYIGVIPDDRAGTHHYTPFPDTFFTTLVTPEIVKRIYQKTSATRAGPVTIPVGWFWKEKGAFGGSGDVGGPHQTREGARQACLESHREIITPEDIRSAPSATSDFEVGF